MKFNFKFVLQKASENNLNRALCYASVYKVILYNEEQREFHFDSYNSESCTQDDDGDDGNGNDGDEQHCEDSTLMPSPPYLPKCPLCHSLKLIRLK